jgi:hypothetical protein
MVSFFAISANRMVLEFLGSQTLLDFHETIVELTDDLVWKRTGDAHESSGFFFMEGAFYTVGHGQQYVDPIKTWLQSTTSNDNGNDNSQPNKRARYLGLNLDTVTNAAVKRMSDIRLDDLSLRLGLRYVHVHNGDVECSVFCVDRKLGPAARVPYPIVHDIWATHLTDCDACQHCPAVIATSTTCETTLGHVALCQSCCKQLRLCTIEQEKIQLYSIWRNEGELSAGAGKETNF